MTSPRRIVLASTSPYRRALLQRLRLEFETSAPEVAEERFPDEPPDAMVDRLAQAKARDVAHRYPDALIIGSDQCAALDGAVLGKPGTHERAAAQLASLSGRRVVFHTGLCLHDSVSGEYRSGVVPFAVRVRPLDPLEVEAYLRVEQPYDCAGSFKSEGLGISLIQAMEGDDPTALVGLPLIRLCEWLREAGIRVPAYRP